MTKVFDLRQTDDPRDYIHRTVQALTEGEVVAIPTDTIYSLVAHALDEDSVEKLDSIKGGNDGPYPCPSEAVKPRKTFIAIVRRLPDV